MADPEVRTRDSARVLLADGAGRVLLFHCRGPEPAPHDTVWMTPGGRMDDGEMELAVAAARELREETGLTVAPEDLGDLVAVSSGRWTPYGGGVVYHTTDSYYFLQVPGHEVDFAGLTEVEQTVVLGHRWWSIEQLRASRDRIYPPGLADLLERLLAGDRPELPVVLPWVPERERVRSCLLAGAVGDALGNPVEFMSLEQIRSRYGPAGLTTMVSNLVTDDTQLTLFTAEGLLRAEPGREVAEVHRAYQDWLATQTLPAPPPGATGLAAEGWLYAQRAPGLACLSGLRHRGPGPPNPDSKGCGTVMRSAPFGLLGYGARPAFDLAAACSRLTHGHPTAANSAGAVAAIVDGLMAGASLTDAVDVTLGLLDPGPDGAETTAALRSAVRLAEQGAPDPTRVASLGEGWVAEEALAIAVYCALVAEHTVQGLLLAVNHSGDSDSTGAICGNLLGVARGLMELPPEWLYQVEGLTTIDTIAAQLADRRAAGQGGW